MRKMRVLLACFIAACTAVPLASPASAQDETCSDWPWVYVWLVPPFWQETYVENENGTLTIRGDLVAGRAAWLADYYTGQAERFVGCTQQAVSDLTTPLAECLTAAAAPIVSSPDPVSRYVEAGTDLVVKVHYQRALDDASALASCPGA